MYRWLKFGKIRVENELIVDSLPDTSLIKKMMEELKRKIKTEIETNMEKIIEDEKFQKLVYNYIQKEFLELKNSNKVN